MSTTRNARVVDRAALPVIDFDFDFGSGSARREETGSAVRSACEEIGFFYAAGHGIADTLVKRVFDLSARFHTLPLEEKQQLAVNRFHRGYLPLASYRLNDKLAPNLSESLVLMHELPEDDPDRLAEKPLQGPNQWPSIPGFRDTMLEYVSGLEALGRKILSAFAAGLDLPAAHFEPMFRRPTTFLRLLHYPPQPADSPENQFGSAPHTDYGAITILAQDSSGGLHVRHRSGEWVQATPIAGAFVVNVGDVMARWTNDRFVSTPHRVVNLSGRDRYSVPFFFDPGMETEVECLSTCASAERPPKYPPIPYGEYLLSRLNTHYAYRHAGAAGV